jgi:hypothetical protein
MFHSTVTAPAPPADTVEPADPIPLSHLALDIDGPTVGWTAYLTGRGIEVLTDDIGRPAIARADARQLLDEQRENEARRQEVVRRQEQQFIEADQRRRSQLWGGLHWTEIPPGVSAAEMWAQAEKDARPRRRSVLEDALSNSGTTLHSLPGQDEQ